MRPMMDTMMDELSESAPPAVAAWIREHEADVGAVLLAGLCRHLEREYARLMGGYPRTKEDLGRFNGWIYSLGRPDVQALLSEVRSYNHFNLRDLLNSAREKYDGKVRWIRKENLFREDGSSKNITLFTRVRTVKQPQISRTSQGPVEAGFGIVLTTGTGSSEEARRAVGTTAAMKVKFDPEKPQPKEEPEDDAESPAGEAAPVLNWLVTRADAQNRPTERQARLPRLFWPDLAVIDYMSGPRYGSRGRYQVLKRMKPGSRVLGEDHETWEATGFDFNNLKDMWAFLREDRDTRLGVKK